MKGELGNLLGIPLVINHYMPTNELWLIERGKKTEIHVHEGPNSGEDIEVWLKKPRIYRVLRLPDLSALIKALEVFELKIKDTTK